MIDRGEALASMDNSRLQEYAACKQLYDYKFNHSLAEPSGSAARYSTVMIHQPLELWYKFGGNYTPNWSMLMQAWNPNQEELLADRFANYTIAKAEQLFKEYTERFGEDLVTYEFVESEVYRTRELAPGLMPFGSKTDIVLRHRNTGETHTLEIKASRWKHILTSLSFNAQVIGQAYVNQAARSMVAFFDLSGRGSLSRFEFEFTQEEVDQWRRERITELMQFQVSVETGVWPRNDKACMRFNRVCPFLELCELGGTQNEAVRERIKLMDKHDPLAYLEEA